MNLIFVYLSLLDIIFLYHFILKFWFQVTAIILVNFVSLFIVAQ